MKNIEMTSTGECPGRANIANRYFKLFLCKLLLLRHILAKWAVLLPMPALGTSSRTPTFRLQSNMQSNPQLTLASTSYNVGFLKRQQSDKNYIEASYHYKGGIKEYKAGDNHHAIEHFWQALKYLPKSTRLLERIGRAYINLNQNERAFELLKLALDVDPNYEPARRSLALYYRYIDC